MAMRCFGRAADLALGFAAGALRALDLMALRAEVFADVRWPAHFFFTAVLAAALDVAFLAMAASLIFDGGKLTQNQNLSGGQRRARAVPTIQNDRVDEWWARLRFAHPTYRLRLNAG